MSSEYVEYHSSTTMFGNSAMKRFGSNREKTLLSVSEQSTKTGTSKWLIRWGELWSTA